jgi:hypothetical protein
MLQDDADHLSAAIQLMSVLGVGVWLMTDLEETFVMGSEIEFRNLMEPGYLRAETERGYLFINLTPLVNRLFELSDEGETIKPHGRGYEILHELGSRESVRNAAELKILEAIREGTFDRIEITLDNGKVRTLHKIDHPDISMSIDAFVKEHPYQSLNIAVRQGGVASLERRETERLD